MYKVTCNSESIKNNAQHLVRAFFPDADVISEVDENQAANVVVCFQHGNFVDADEKSVAGNGELIIAEITGLTAKPDIDRALYDRLSEYTARALPWGTLTGVRPTKLATAAINKGLSKEQFTEQFMTERRVSAEKADLAYDVAVREKTLIETTADRQHALEVSVTQPQTENCNKANGAGYEAKLKYLNTDTFSLYVGIPFCPSVCNYCSFSAGPLSRWADKVDAYLEALKKEIEAAARLCRDKSLSTVYIGGGTPTTLTERQLEALLKTINNNFDTKSIPEFTLEAGRPDSITEEKLAIAKNLGITRISINPQTMQDKTLEIIGRRHTVEEVYKAFETARNLGFNNINMDLIAGLQGERAADMADTLRQVEILRPESLTVHSLAIKRSARIREEKITGKAANAATYESEVNEMLRLSRESAARQGLNPYYLYRQKSIAGNFENIGFAKPGFEGLYNVLMMEEVQSIIACGAGASTKYVSSDGTISRSFNVKDVNSYIAQIDEMISRKNAR